MDTRTDSPSDSRPLGGDQGVRTCRSAKVEVDTREWKGETEPDWNIVRGEG